MRNPVKAASTFLLLVVLAMAQAADEDLTKPIKYPVGEQETLTLDPPFSASSEALHLQETAVPGQSWVASGSVNPKGTFSLVGNANDPTNSPYSIRVYLGDDEPQLLKPHEVASWTCDELGDGASLKVRNNAGDVIHAARFKCGDALYLKSLTAP